MALAELIEEVPAPEQPLEIKPLEHLLAIQASLGLVFPSDYAQFCSTFGSGEFAGTIQVFNAFADNYQNLIKCLCEIYSDQKSELGNNEFPYAVYPSKPGLFPWGTEASGGTYFWLTEGNPNHWPTIIEDESSWERWNMPMTTFLAKFFKREIEPRLLGKEWREENLKILRQFKPRRMSPP
jgi:hypothetical protein